MTDPADAFGEDDDTPPVNDQRPTVRPRTIRARQRRKEQAEAKAAAVRDALGGPRRGSAELPDVLPAVPPPAGKVSAELVALGPPPSDPLEAQAWLHRQMITASWSAILDETLSEAERRKELRNFAKVAAVLLPDARRWKAEELIRRDGKPEEERRGRGPDLEPVPDGLEMDDGAAPQPG